jgi:glycogen debranching enzyme
LLFPIGSTRERNNFQNWQGYEQNWTRYSRKGYKLRASQVEFLPEPRTDVTCRIQYVPVYVDMVADGDTFDGINGWEKMVALGVAIEMRVIEKRAANDLMQLYAPQLERVEALKTERDAEAPKTIVDEQRLRGRNGWIGSRFDNSFDPTFW